MHVPRANIEYTSRPRRSPWSSRRCRSLLAAVAEAIQKGMAGPLKAMNEQGEEIRRLQGQITALRIESKQSPSEGDGDRGARNKRARPPSAPTSPRERMQRGEWCLKLNPFDVRCPDLNPGPTLTLNNTNPTQPGAHERAHVRL